MPAVAGRLGVAAPQAVVDKPGEVVEIAGAAEPLPLRQCRRLRKNGHYPLGCVRNWSKNVETFFTSLAGFIRVRLLWHTGRACSIGFY